MRRTLAEAYERAGKSLFLSMVAIVMGIETFLAPAPRYFSILLVGSAGFLLSTFANVGVKALMRHDRPQPRETSRKHPLYPIVRYSFPSFHTQIGFTMVVVGSLFMYTHTWLIPVMFLALAIFTAYTRLRLEAHYKKDVVAGAVLGSAIGLIIYFPLADVVAPAVATILFIAVLVLFFAIPSGEVVPDEKG